MKKLSEGEMKKFRKEYFDDSLFVRQAVSSEGKKLIEYEDIAAVFKSFKTYLLFRQTCGSTKTIRNYIKLGLARNIRNLYLEN